MKIEGLVFTTLLFYFSTFSSRQPTTTTTISTFSEQQQQHPHSTTRDQVIAATMYVLTVVKNNIRTNKRFCSLVVVAVLERTTGLNNKRGRQAPVSRVFLGFSRPTRLMPLVVNAGGRMID